MQLIVLQLLLFASVLMVSYGTIKVTIIIVNTSDSDVNGVKKSFLEKLFIGTCKSLGEINRKLRLRKFEVKFNQLMVTAGNPWNLDASELLGACEVAFMVTWLALVSFYIIFLQSFSLFIPILAGGIAFFVPQYLIKEKATIRQVRINRNLPYAIDFMVLAIESGATFYEAIKIYVRNSPSYPLADEFKMVLQEIDYGSTKEQALSKMSNRIESENLTSLINAINAGEVLGTPVGKVLRIQSELIRQKRTERAEKLAGEAGTKILLPSLLIMIAALLIIMSPAIINIVRGSHF